MALFLWAHFMSHFYRQLFGHVKNKWLLNGYYLAFVPC